MPTNPLDSSQVRIAGTGAFWKAPLGTALPADAATAWGAGFVNLGYATDGFTLKQDKKTTPVTAWQTIAPVRLITTDLLRTFSFELLQTNIDTLALGWGGATVTPGTAGAYTLDIGSADNADDFILGIDWSDGVTAQRIILGNAALDSLPTIKYVRSDAVRYAFDVQALAPADGTASVLVYGTDVAVGGAS